MARYVKFLYLTCLVGMPVKSHEELRELAYGMKVTLSSEYQGAGNPNPYPGRKAVNGLLNDFAHTDPERSPWMMIDLKRNYIIHEIEIIARTDCCTQQFHDLDVRVGKDANHMELCGHVSGPARITGQRFAVWCPHNTVGRYVKLQIVRGKENYLTPAEVHVWGKRRKVS